jgi:hypothetical protein
MFKLRVKRDFASEWIEFKTASEFYNFINNQYEQSIEEQWQWYDYETGDWKHFSEHYTKGNKKKLWFI